MAYVSDTTRAGLGETTLGQRLRSMTARIGEMRRRRQIFRATLTELEGLSDRDLNDLGLNRGDLRRVAADAANGE